MNVLVDRFGRPLTNLRVSLNYECNYSCLFCHREGVTDKRKQELTREQLLSVIQAAYELGVKSFKLTGGEPLLRRDLTPLAREISNLGRDLELSITTNGFFLEERAAELAEAGVHRVNVSLHSLRENVYSRLTGGGALARVLSGIDAALDAGLRVKINFVLTQLNREDVPRVLEYASSKGVDVNIIELIPLGLGERSFNDLYLAVEEVLPYIRDHATKLERRELHNRPVYVLESGVRVELVANYRNPAFCAGCRRLRLTHDGRLKVCLYREEPSIDLRQILASTACEEVLEGVKAALIRANELREPYFRLEGGVVKDVYGNPLGPPRNL